MRHAAFASSLSLHDGTNVLPASCPHGGSGGGGGGDGEADGGGGGGGGDGEADGGGSGRRRERRERRRRVRREDAGGILGRVANADAASESMPQFGLAVSPHFGSCIIILLLQ